MSLRLCMYCKHFSENGITIALSQCKKIKTTIEKARITQCGKAARFFERAKLPTDCGDVKQPSQP